MKKYFYVVLLLFVYQCNKDCFGQSIDIKGTVYSNNSPVENASVQILKQKQLAITNRDGVFYLKVEQLPIILRITHISCETLDIKVTERDLKKASDSIIFIKAELEPRIQTLQGISLLGAKVQKAYTKAASIVDYEIVGDYMYFILSDGKRYFRMTDLNSQTIDEIQIKSNVKELYKDKLNNLYVLTQDSSYQVFYYNDSLLLAYPTDLVTFEQVIYPIVANTECCLYLQYFALHNQYLSYIKVEKGTKKRTILTTVFDKVKAQINSHEYQKNQIQNAMVQAMKNTPFNYEYEENLKILIEEDNKLFNGVAYYTSVLSKPLYCPLILVNNNLYLFNHFNGFLEQYTLNGKLQNRNSINYQNEKNWAKEIIVNEEKTKCYAKFIQGGIVTLKEIDLETGKTKGNYVLEQHAFPRKIKIKDGYAFYLYKNLNQDEVQNRYLWKQELE